MNLTKLKLDIDQFDRWLMVVFLLQNPTSPIQPTNPFYLRYSLLFVIMCYQSLLIDWDSNEISTRTKFDEISTRYDSFNQSSCCNIESMSIEDHGAIWHSNLLDWVAGASWTRSDSTRGHLFKALLLKTNYHKRLQFDINIIGVRDGNVTRWDQIKGAPSKSW